jgi:hypothetical protein
MSEELLHLPSATDLGLAPWLSVSCIHWYEHIHLWQICVDIEVQCQHKWIWSYPWMQLIDSQGASPRTVADWRSHNFNEQYICNLLLICLHSFVSTLNNVNVTFRSRDIDDERRRNIASSVCIHRSRNVWQHMPTKVIFGGMCLTTATGDTWGCLQSDAVLEEIKSSSLINWRNTARWWWGSYSNTMLDENSWNIWETRRIFGWMGKLRAMYIHLRGKMVDYLGRDFLSKVNYKIVVKLTQVAGGGAGARQRCRRRAQGKLPPPPACHCVCHQ